jgi:cytidine deaminase
MIDQRLMDAAIDQLNRRWPGTGWGVAAAVRLDDGQVLTSVGLDNLNSGASLCAEAGALCQAYTLDRQVTASVCVCRDEGTLSVLAPCGICQERLALWGPDVHVAVADTGSPTGWSSRRLAELHPHYWGTHFATGGGWPSAETHRE